MGADKWRYAREALMRAVEHLARNEPWDAYCEISDVAQVMEGRGDDPSDYERKPRVEFLLAKDVPHDEEVS